VKRITKNEEQKRREDEEEGQQHNKDIVIPIAIVRWY
jgi:hypothetical protein